MTTHNTIKFWTRTHQDEISHNMKYIRHTPHLHSELLEVLRLNLGEQNLDIRNPSGSTKYRSL